MDWWMDGEGVYLFAVKQHHLLNMQLNARVVRWEGDKNVCVHCLDKKGTPFNPPSSLLPTPPYNLRLIQLVAIKYLWEGVQSQSSPTTFLHINQEVELDSYKRGLLKAGAQGQLNHGSKGYRTCMISSYIG